MRKRLKRSLVEGPEWRRLIPKWPACQLPSLAQSLTSSGTFRDGAPWDPARASIASVCAGTGCGLRKNESTLLL